PTITAIVVVHGSAAATVAAAVESLLASTGVDVFVVLVDNASPDGGVAVEPWRRHPRVVVVTSARNDGFAAGVNQALARRRRGDLVWLLNDDATVEPDCLAHCAATLRGAGARGAVVAAPRVMLASQPNLIDSLGVVLRRNGEAFNAFTGQRWTGQVADGETLTGACFAAGLFRADAFDANSVGRLDQRYRLYYEDIDWGLRAAARGLTAVASPDAVVHHVHAGSTRTLGEPARYELVQRNLLLCAAKNLTWRSALRVWATRLAVHAKGTITGPMRARRWKAVAAALVGLVPVVVARRRQPHLSLAAEAALFARSEGHFPNIDTTTFLATPLATPDD
ncbi:MAG TPA: glycosyltransferase, partial [Ilumatobacteraceae bacterium]|nr:glycosyltransferase [Ilumatobacteraceae bacterium]